MKQVFIYVEGRSDVLAMNALLKPLIEHKYQQQVSLEFFEAPRGDKKKGLLLKTPEKAVSILQNNLLAEVAIMPDLYPKNKGFPHERFAEMHVGILTEFRKVLAKRQITDNQHLFARFHVFCFKYDLEALVLAAPDALVLRLAVDTLHSTWTIPVEDQNHDTPPKRIVEQLFQQYQSRYIEAVDCPLILGLTDYQQIADACPQHFQPFVEFLEGISYE